MKHKWRVLKICWKNKLVWQGIIHDWSKFHPIEFFPYANRFFSNRSLTPIQEQQWQKALLHHYQKNKHHWNHWVVDQKEKKAIPMPEKYIMEMVCDWRAMNPADPDDSKQWYQKKQHKMILDPESRKFLEKILEL